WLQRCAAIANSLPRQNRYPWRTRKGGFEYRHVAPSEACLAALDIAFHFRLRLKRQNAAGFPNGAGHPERIDALVSPNVQHGSAAQVETHQRFERKSFGPVAIS